VARTVNHLLYFFQIPARFFDRDDVRMTSELNDNVGRDVIAVAPGKLYIRRAAASGQPRCDKSENVWPADLLLVVVRRTNHGRVVAELGTYSVSLSVSWADSIPVPRHDLIRRSRGHGNLEYVATFVIGEQDGFAGRTLHDNTGGGVRE